MAAINDLIARIKDPELRQRIEKEVKDLTKQKKFGLVFENHVPEMTLLYDYPISRGCKVIRKVDDDKKLSEDILWEVKKVSRSIATCQHTVTHEELQISVRDIICVAKNGEPIYPCLKYMDSIQKAPDSDLWHTLIEADNYHALQLLAYLYPGMVDCIYIDPPYNSGATDWKYNNNYVDGNDSYRHSKWLAMMESRLLLAKKLLNPDNSVLIVTIDEKEYLHLGCLLEEIFPDADGDKDRNYKGRVAKQMVSSVIARNATARKGLFSRSNEFIYIIEMGAAAVTPLPLSDEWRTNAEDKRGVNLRWADLIRCGDDGIRRYSPKCFYPILVSSDGKRFLGADEPLELDVNRNTYVAPEGSVAIWPLHKDGEEGRWGYSKENLIEIQSKGYVKLGKLRGDRMRITMLTEGEAKKVEDGLFPIEGYNEDGSIICNSELRQITPTTQWSIVSHNARTGGTELIQSIIGNRFSYPKSLYAVHDVIRFFVANNPNALILDFFSGSGTTLHAVNLLNKEDGGHRRCIMVTNNEISAEEESAFRAKGLHKGDEEWEKYGIARYVNWPRTKCSIEGVDVNGKPIQGEYITSNTQEITEKRTIKQLSFDIPDGTQGVKVKKQIVALINDKKMPQNSVSADCPYIVKEDATTAILFDSNSIDDFLEDIHDDIETIYVVTTNNKTFNAAKNLLNELPEKTKTVPVNIPMAEGFAANAAFYKLTFLDKEAVSIGAQLDNLLSILWMKAGAHGVCPTHAEGEYVVFPENRMAILIDEYGFDELQIELKQYPEIKTVYIIDDSEENYRSLAAQLKVKNSYQLYRDYLDNFKINIERR